MSLLIRETTKADIPDIAAIHVAGWQGAYGDLLDQDYIESQSVEKRIADWTEWFSDDTVTRFIAFKGDKAVGFLAAGPLRTAPSGTSKIRPLYSSEIYALYLLPEIFRQGVGTALIKEAVKSLKAQKHQSMCLWVLADNKRACGFYEAIGGQRVGKKMREFGSSKKKEACYGWRDIDEVLSR